MKAAELKEHFQKIGTWVDWSRTVDRFILGDPDTEVKAIAVCWQPRTETLRLAVEKGCNVVVCHENLFYRHWDNDERILKQPHVVAKKKFIEQSGLVVFRLHDMWDQMPKVGIVDSWAAHLGLGKEIESETFHKVYPSPKPTLGELAKHVAAAVRYLK